MAALAEMYVQGVSTRKVKTITEELCGHSFSASAISAINERLDESLAFVPRRKCAGRGDSASGWGDDKGWELASKVFPRQCAGCGRQTSVTAGTVMHAKKRRIRR